MVSIPQTKICFLSFPVQGVLLVTLTRTKELNTVPTQGHWNWTVSGHGWIRIPNLLLASSQVPAEHFVLVLIYVVNKTRSEL